MKIILTIFLTIIITMGLFSFFKKENNKDNKDKNDILLGMVLSQKCAKYKTQN